MSQRHYEMVIKNLLKKLKIQTKYRTVAEHVINAAENHQSDSLMHRAVK